MAPGPVSASVLIVFQFIQLFSSVGTSSQSPHGEYLAITQLSSCLWSSNKILDPHNLGLRKVGSHKTKTQILTGSLRETPSHSVIYKTVFCEHFICLKAKLAKYDLIKFSLKYGHFFLNLQLLLQTSEIMSFKIYNLILNALWLTTFGREIIKKRYFIEGECWFKTPPAPQMVDGKIQANINHNCNHDAVTQLTYH